MSSASVSAPAPASYVEIGDEINAASLPEDHAPMPSGSWYVSGTKDCVNADDYSIARKASADLLYGEVLPAGVDKLLGPNYLDGRSGTSCVDLGAGGGKLALQIFLQCPNMKRVSGIELAPNRVNMGVNIAKRVFAKRNATAKELYSFVTKDPDPELLLASVPKAGEVSLVVLEGDEKRKTRSSGPRSFYLRQGDLFTATEVTTADIVICETNFDHAMHPKLRSLFNQMKHGARLMTYKDLHSVYDVLKPHPIPGFQVLNDGDDRFLTSWSIVNGHHFYVYKRTSCT